MFNFRQDGFSTIEILLASFILVSAIASSALATFTIQNLSLTTQLTSQALTLLSSEMELSKLESIDDYPINSSEVKGDYRVIKTYKPLSREAYELTIEVIWLEPPSKQQSIKATTVLVNLNHALGASTCDLYLNNLTNPPTVLSSFDVPNSPNITDIKVRGGFVFISTDDSTLGLPDLYILKINPNNSLDFVSSLNTGPGIAALAVAGNILYVANTSTNSQLQIINISDPSGPSLMKSYKLPNISGVGAVGSAVYYLDSKIFLGTLKTTGPEFNIVDVSNSSAPLILGSYETDTLINAIVVDKDMAYLATPNQQQLRILNVSNPYSVQLTSSFSDSGYQVQDGRSLDVLGKNVYFGRTVGGFNNPSNHEIYNLETADNLLNKVSSKDLAASARSVFFRSDYLFLGTNDSSKEWQEWKITDGQLGFTYSLDLEASVVAQACEAQKFFVALEQGKIIVISHG